MIRVTKKRSPRSLRQRLIIAARNQGAYCHILTAITGAHLVIDHILPEVAGGQAVWENLCVACHSCNEFKGAQVKARDPFTGRLVHLFHPHQQTWGEQFCWSEEGTNMIGLTSTGRATVVALNMNHPAIVEARRRWVRVGWHPPREDR